MNFLPGVAANNNAHPTPKSTDGMKNAVLAELVYLRNMHINKIEVLNELDAMIRDLESCGWDFVPFKVYHYFEKQGQSPKASKFSSNSDAAAAAVGGTGII